ncbi:hypothetical protein [Alistipes timonensis]|uniref:hypothetical protein n=1 Tax=Alistipes timonensis TaxID=1465754 RepID=UPI00266EE0F2|nr:hypothetical protein [Alistipes timonensis]
MKTIEERAKEYAAKCHGQNTEWGFIAGAQSEREELTRWHNIETMPVQKGVLLKLSSGDYCVGIQDLRGKIWGLPSYLRNPKPVGWRPIHENE